MATRSELRASVPSQKRILEYWISDEAASRLRAIQDRLGLGSRVSRKILTVKLKEPACMICERPRSGWSSLERCHILGVANALEVGATKDEVSHPSNFILMCRRCHLDSPTISDLDAFWIWVAGRQSFMCDFVDVVTKISHQYNTQVVRSALLAYFSSDVMPVEGYISQNSFEAILVSFSKKVECGDLPLYDSVDQEDIFCEKLDEIRQSWMSDEDISEAGARADQHTEPNEHEDIVVGVNPIPHDEDARDQQE